MYCNAIVIVGKQLWCKRNKIIQGMMLLKTCNGIPIHARYILFLTQHTNGRKRTYERYLLHCFFPAAFCLVWFILF